jgi:hypothetical protein
MRRHQQCVLGLGISILGVLILSPALMGQASSDSQKAVGIPTDWSHHHVIFSRPATPEQARRVEKHERYWQQQRRRSPAKLREAATLRDVENGDALLPELRLDPSEWFGGKNKNHQGFKGDWAQDIGPGATVGDINYPAKFSFSATTANCIGAPQPDFVVYPTGLPGTSSQASIVAYDNIYSGCSGDGAVPTVYWAYNTDNGSVTSSPVFSRDGTQLAFVLTGGGYASRLVLLKWAASTTDSVGSPTSLPRLTNAAYPTCTAPCMTATALRDPLGAVQSVTYSSVFYDYDSDTAFVGDDGGWLHQFNPVFNGTPAEVKSAGWPVQVNPISPTPLTSPVFDDTSQKVFVADNGGFLYRVGPLTAAVADSSGPLDVSSENDGGPGIVQGPIVDSSAEVVYVFASSDGSGLCQSGNDCTAVYELPVNFAENATGHEVVVGESTLSGNPPTPLFIGGFDSTYLNSVNASGHLYVCGNTGGPPILYQVTIQAGVAQSLSTGGPVLSNAFTPCSPVTDVLNPNASGGATEWIFASAEADGISVGCSAGGCIFNFKDTPWLPATTYAVGQEVLDSRLRIEVVTVGGISGGTTPAWSATIGGTTSDGGVTWLDQGPVTAVPYASWTATHNYTKGNPILDPNGNIELVTSSGTRTSGGTRPTFNTTPGGTTSDGTGGLVWTNVGAIATAAITEDGGTSGIIWDNTVGTGTLAGASQVYFSTLSGGCGAGTDGCAVQASQSALH